ncbi:UxaA family hydrolase [Lihuaxuella thermophila]|uniref:Altronate dehydratase small subunit n=1 Tax=Lihuaxuella thermophila TaxID=1173111 RepID=A0A1H8J7J5_9BACL|nr:UxaA family hydrolase [Lihuaxuella thermophila]SEN76445.1 altronate dehydratase small subunit [Lihuaxuella thermophila]
METVYKTVMMKPQDNVAVALSNIPAGTVVQMKCRGKIMTVKLKDLIEFGHKFAVVPIKSGEDVIKYGEVIGLAVKDIAVGEHVHIHNVEGKRGRGDKMSHAK